MKFIMLIASRLCRTQKGSRKAPGGFMTYLLIGLTSSARLSKACRGGVAVEAVEEA